MKEVMKSRLVTLLILLGIAVIIFFSLSDKPTIELTDEESIICIGEKATLYTSLGCSHCEAQKKLLGDSLNKLKILDCYYYGTLCHEEKITAYPTWKIGNKKILGVQTINELKELTGC